MMRTVIGYIVPSSGSEFICHKVTDEKTALSGFLRTSCGQEVRGAKADVLKNVPQNSVVCRRCFRG